MQKINFSIHGNMLSAALFYPEVKKTTYPTILFVHGWTSEKERSYQYAEALSNIGYFCFLFDLPGHGQSEGDITTFTSEDFLNAGVAVYDYVCGLDGVDPHNISAVGSSFGGYLVAMLSEKRQLSNIALRVPADYPNEDFIKIHSLTGGSDPEIIEWRKLLKNPEETYALAALHAFNGNVLIIESELDDRVPHQTIQNFMNAIKDKNKITHIVMENAPHSVQESKFRDEVERILVKWFGDLQ